MATAVYKGFGMSFPLLFGGKDTKYASWKHNVRWCCASIRAWSIFNGVEKEPERPDVDEDSEAYRTWKSDNANYKMRLAQAAVIIHLSCSENLRAMVSHLEHPRDMWDALKKRLDNTYTDNGRGDLSSKCMDLVPLQGEGIDIYLDKVLEIRNALKPFPEESNNNLFKMIIKNKMPKMFADCLMVLRHERPDLSLEDMITDSIDYDIRWAHLNPALTTAQSATPIQTFGTQAITAKCIRCGKDGHWAASCYPNRNDKKRRRRS